eukprot:346730-Prorocentrum_minimum.AAC.1
MRGESPDQGTPTIRRTEGDRRCNNIEGLGFQRACKGSNSSRFNGGFVGVCYEGLVFQRACKGSSLSRFIGGFVGVCYRGLGVPEGVQGFQLESVSLSYRALLLTILPRQRPPLLGQSEGHSASPRASAPRLRLRPQQLGEGVRAGPPLPALAAHQLRLVRADLRLEANLRHVRQQPARTKIEQYTLI